MSAERPQADAQASRHTRAVANSLRLATEAAARGDYVEALAWVDTVRAIGEELPHELQASRSAWLEHLRQGDGHGDGASRTDGARPKRRARHG
ncbi:MAG: hypothetical protein ACTHM1_05040 [Solirubrobacteraceae bacterium]